MTSSNLAVAPRAADLVSFPDLADARTKFRQASFKVRHELVGHPLFTIDALADLADRLPDGVAEHNLGKVDAVMPGGEVPRLDQGLGEIVRGIETNGCWVALPIRLQVPAMSGIPGYQELFDQLMTGLAPVVPGGEKVMSGFHGVIFLAAANSTTPSHVDGEIGFLLHVKGQKRLSIGRFPTTHAEIAELERFHAHAHRNTSEMPVGVEHFDIEPGEGVHVPALVPHWVETGPEVAISLSVGFQTPANLQRQGVYMWNTRARRLGLSPKPHGEDARRDQVKASLLWRVAHARRRVAALKS